MRSERDFALLVQKMRESQTAYFKRRTCENLIEAKQLEAQVDGAAAAIVAFEPQLLSTFAHVAAAAIVDNQHFGVNLTDANPGESREALIERIAAVVWGDIAAKVKAKL